MSAYAVGLFALPGAAEIIQEVCAAEGVDPALLDRLVATEQAFAGMMRRRGIMDALDEVISAGVGQST